MRDFSVEIVSKFKHYTEILKSDFQLFVRCFLFYVSAKKFETDENVDSSSRLWILRNNFYCNTWAHNFWPHFAMSLMIKNVLWSIAKFSDKCLVQRLVLFGLERKWKWTSTCLMLIHFIPMLHLFQSFPVFCSIIN